MATKQAGRKVKLKVGGNIVAGLQTKTIAVNGQAIDVSDDGDSGFISYLPGILADRQIVLTGDGYEEDGVLRGLAMGPEADSFLAAASLEWEDGGKIAGKVVLSGYQETGAYNDGVKFNFTLSTDGEWTYTPPSGGGS